MKKAATLSITTFYLLLTTGMFVCLVHCAAESLIAKPATSIAMQHTGKHCASKNDCDCCKKHGNFIIKENVKPAVDFQFIQAAVVFPNFQIEAFLLPASVAQSNTWQKMKAPPDKSGKAIAIQNRSLLI